MNKLLCRECGWQGTEPLTATSPFDENNILTACPECLDVNNLVGVCEVKGCTEEATCGTSTESGYLRCCGKHFDALQV